MYISSVYVQCERKYVYLVIAASISIIPFFLTRTEDRHQHSSILKFHDNIHAVKSVRTPHGMETLGSTNYAGNAVDVIDQIVVPFLV